MARKQADLSTELGRKAAWNDLIWRDHGFIRWICKNRWWIDEDMLRMAQPSPGDVAQLAKMGIKTIINLRDVTKLPGEYLLEKEACEKHGIKFENLVARSRDTPHKEMIFEVKALFERIEYPAALHCKSGSDRAGIVSVLYAHFKMGQPIEQATQQLSLKYGHLRQGKTGILDYFFGRYLKETGDGEKKISKAG